jgi:CRP-like cAMP-binding protein
MIENFEFYQHIYKYSVMSEDDFSDGDKFWSVKMFKKGDFFNFQDFVCTNLGFIKSGIFRLYYLEQNGEEKNLFFFSENQFMVSFRSFIRQYPCIYYIEALEDAELLVIKHKNLSQLYDKNKGWANFGRILAEEFFEIAQVRMEWFILYTAEQRYTKFKDEYPGIMERLPLYHISSYLGIKSPSLSRIRRRLG